MSYPIHWPALGIEVLHDDARPAWGVFVCGQDETPSCEGIFFEREMADSHATTYWPHLGAGECDVFEVVLTDRGTYAANEHRTHAQLRSLVETAHHDAVELANSLRSSFAMARPSDVAECACGGPGRPCWSCTQQARDWD